MRIEFKNYKLFIDGKEIKNYKKGNVNYEIIQTMLKLKRFTMKHILNKYKGVEKNALYVLVNRLNTLCKEHLNAPLIVKDENAPEYWFVNHALVEREEFYESFIINIPKNQTKKLKESFEKYLYTNAPTETDEFIKF
jgi:hypothetical protein